MCDKFRQKRRTMTLSWRENQQRQGDELARARVKNSALDFSSSLMQFVISLRSSTYIFCATTTRFKSPFPHEEGGRWRWYEKTQRTAQKWDLHLPHFEDKRYHPSASCCLSSNILWHCTFLISEKLLHLTSCLLLHTQNSTAELQ